MSWGKKCIWRLSFPLKITKNSVKVNFLTYHTDTAITNKNRDLNTFYLILSALELHNCVRGMNNKHTLLLPMEGRKKKLRKPLRRAHLPFRDTKYTLMILVCIKNLKKPSSHQEFITNHNFRKVLCIQSKGRKFGTKCWKEEIRLSLERLKNPSTSLQELTLKIHTNKPCSLEWNLIKMTKIPQQSKTFQNAAPLNPVSNKAQQLLLDPNLSLPRNTDISLQKQTPGFLTELVFPAKPFQVLKETVLHSTYTPVLQLEKPFIWKVWQCLKCIIQL